MYFDSAHAQSLCKKRHQMCSMHKAVSVLNIANKKLWENEIRPY